MSDTLAQNPYAAPGSALQEQHGNQVPSIEEALSRGYDFSIGGLIGEAWSLVKGTKGVIFAASLVYFVVTMLVSGVLGFALGMLGLAPQDADVGLQVAFQLVLGLAVTALTYPFMAGLIMIGIRRAAGQPVSFNEIFSHFGRALPLAITAVTMTLLVYLGYLLLIIPGIYLSIAYMLAIPLVVERGLSPWQALEASRKAISQHWFKVFGLFLLLILIMLLGMLPLFIGTIWAGPLMIIAMGVLYRTIFGVRPLSN